MKKEADVVLTKLEEVAATECPECEGIGHTRKKCPTYKRLLGITKGLNGARVLMNAARVDVTG